jgi:hypothetical protein
MNLKSVAISLAMVLSLSTFRTLRAGPGDEQFYFRDVKIYGHPITELVQGENGLELHIGRIVADPDSTMVSFNLVHTKPGFGTQAEGTSLSLRFFLPILAHFHLKSLESLNSHFFSGASDNGLFELEDFRAYTVSGNWSRPTVDELLDRAAVALANLQSPNFSDVSGNYLNEHLVSAIYSHDGLKKLAAKLEALTHGAISIQKKDGAPITEKPFGRGPLFSRKDSAGFFLKAGSQRWELVFNFANFATLSTELEPIKAVGLPLGPCLAALSKMRAQTPDD